MDHNEAQLDFILEMHSKDNPKTFKFTRPGTVNDDLKEVLAKKAWANVLIGPALARFMGTRLPNANVMAVLRRMGKRKG